jgi:hypothetical protein
MAVAYDHLAEELERLKPAAWCAVCRRGQEPEVPSKKYAAKPLVSAIHEGPISHRAAVVGGANIVWCRAFNSSSYEEQRDGAFLDRGSALPRSAVR